MSLPLLDRIGTFSETSTLLLKTVHQPFRIMTWDDQTWFKVSGHLLVTCIRMSAGWMMWNWMVTALALGTTLVLYDGSPLHPHPGALWDLVRRITVNELCLI